MATLNERMAALEATVEAQRALMQEVRDDLKKLLGFRNWMLGMSAAVSLVISIVGAWMKR